MLDTFAAVGVMVVTKVLPWELVVSMAMGSSLTADVVFTVLPAEFVVVMTTAGRVSFEVTVFPFELVVVTGTTALALGVSVVEGVMTGAGDSEEDCLWDVSGEGVLLLDGTTALGVVPGVGVAGGDAVLEGVAEAEGVESSELDGRWVGVWLGVPVSLAPVTVEFPSDGVWRFCRSCTAATMSLLAKRGFFSCTFSTP